MGAIRDPADGRDADVDVRFDAYLDGEFTKPTDGAYYHVENPYTRTVWAAVPRCTAADVDRAVEVANRAFRSEAWRGLLPTKRGELLREIADAVEEHVDELGQLAVRENGRTITEMEAEARGVCRWFRYYADLCSSELEGRTIPVENNGGEFHTFVEKEPYGVVGGITAWNSPLTLAAMKVAPALAAGNTFVHKPSQHTPVATLQLAEIIDEETDLPDGVYNVVPGFGEAGAALSGHADADFITFTGSEATGKQVAASAGENLNPVMVELGGKNPHVVFASADVSNAANGVIKGIFQSTGQVCTSGARLLVHEDVHDELVDAILEKSESISLGDPSDPDTDIGPVAFEDQRAKIQRYVEHGHEQGLRHSQMGTIDEDAPSDLFVKPTLFTGVESGMVVAQEEIFGPVLAVIPFSTEAEAIELANDVKYGLAAGVWTDDIRQAHRVSSAIDAGTIWVNEYRQSAFNAPFGGFKDSGIGRQDGKEGLEEYLHWKTTFVDLSGEVSQPFSGHPIDQ
jgi:aldehyde dehydrogenase (NAD+)